MSGLAKPTAILLAAVVLVAVVTAGLAVGATNNAAAWGSDAAPDVEIYEEQVTVASHDRADMSSPLDYEDDDGNVATLPARLNDSINNSVGVTYTRVDDDQLGAFPHDKNISTVDASEWTKDASGSAGTGSVSDATLSGVEAVTFSTSSQTAGDTMVFTMANFTIDSDAEKRVLRSFVDVESLGADAEVHIVAADSDGDTKTAVINSSRDATANDVVANTTGNGIVYQQRLGDLATDGSGDGSFDSIAEVRVTVVDGDATVTFTDLDVAKKTALTLGEQRVDDSDGGTELTALEEVRDGGVVKLDDLATMGSWADDAEIMNLEVYGLVYEPEHLASEDVLVEFDPGFQADYTYEHGSTTYTRFTVPAPIDISHHGLSLRLGEQSYVSDRYVGLDYKEGTGSTDLTDVENYDDASSALGSKGDTVSLDSTVPTGDTIVVRLKILQTEDEFSAYQNTGSSGGGASSGGLSNLPLIGGLIAALLGFLKMRGN